MRLTPLFALTCLVAFAAMPCRAQVSGGPPTTVVTPHDAPVARQAGPRDAKPGEPASGTVNTPLVAGRPSTNQPPVPDQSR